jgi:hypothetical protein
MIANAFAIAIAIAIATAPCMMTYVDTSLTMIICIAAEVRVQGRRASDGGRAAACDALSSDVSRPLHSHRHGGRSQDKSPVTMYVKCTEKDCTVGSWGDRHQKDGEGLSF